MVFYFLYFTFNIIMLNMQQVTGQASWSTDNFLLVTDSGVNTANVYGISLLTGQTYPLFSSRPAGTNPIAVTYDSLNKIVYWSDVGSVYRSISKYSLNTSTYSIVYFDSNVTAALDGLTVDPSAQIIYFADAGYGRVGQMSTDGTGYRIISAIVNSQPRGIVFDKQNSLLYWTDWSSTFPAIYRAPTSTGITTTLVGGNLLWPNALAIDFYNGVMYWGDSGLHKIEMANIDGTGRTVLIQSTSARYFGMSLDSSYLYYTDWSLSAVVKMDRRSYSTVAVASTVLFGRLNGIILYNSTDRSMFGNAKLTSTSTISPPTSTTTTTTTTTTPSTVPTTSTTTSTTSSSATMPSSLSTEILTKTSTTQQSSVNSGDGNQQTQGIVITIIVVVVVAVAAIIIAIAIVAGCVICRRRSRVPSTKQENQIGVFAVSNAASQGSQYETISPIQRYEMTTPIPPAPALTIPINYQNGERGEYLHFDNYYSQLYTDTDTDVNHYERIQS